MSVAALLSSLQALQLSRGWAIIGAVARNAWAPPRATTDLDLTVVADGATLAAVSRALRSVGYTQVREQRADPADSLPDILIFRGQLTEPRQVDVLVAKTSFEEDVLSNTETISIGSLEVPVAQPEALVVYKLLADRPRDRDDIRAILRTQGRTARPFDWSYVQRWAEFWQIRDRLDRLRSEIQIP